MEEFQGMTEFQGDFQGDYQTDDEKKRKIKTLAIAGAAAVVVLGVAIWGVASVVSNVNSRKSDEQVAQVDEGKKDDKPTGDANGAVSPADQYTAQEPSDKNDLPVIEETPQPVSPIATVPEVPETGPSDFALTALLMGVATTLVLVNLGMKREEA